jgi:hypothetical protein
MKYFNYMVLTLALLLSTNVEAIDIIVVANTDQADVKLEKRQVRDIFMRNNSSLSLKPIALIPNSAARFVFNTKVVGLTESRIQSYWAQMRFSGRDKAPPEFESVDEMLDFLKANKDTVAYLPADTRIPDGLSIVYQTN